MISLQEAHSHAVRLTVDAVGSVSPDQLARPTPCTDWNLAELLDHMTVQNVGFAAAAAGRGADETLWATGAHRDDPITDYLDSAATVAKALAEPGVAEQPFTLPELSRDQTFTGSQAITMHMVDSLVHAWDVARTIGRNIHPDPDAVRMTLDIAKQIPDDQARSQPGAHFAPRATIPDEASDLDHVLALLGRSPYWSPPHSPQGGTC